MPDKCEKLYRCEECGTQYRGPQDDDTVVILKLCDRCRKKRYERYWAQAREEVKQLRPGITLIGVAFLEEAKQGAGLSYGKLEVPESIRKLGRCHPGSGHDNFLRQIRVMFDATAPQYIWMQLERYHWLNINSESKMHCILRDEFRFERLDPRTMLSDNLMESVALFEEKRVPLETVMDDVPMGFLLRARCETNYAELKTMYKQRKHHKLKWWRDIFVEFCHSLPEFIELTGVK